MVSHYDSTSSGTSILGKTPFGLLIGVPGWILYSSPSRCSKDRFSSGTDKRSRILLADPGMMGWYKIATCRRTSMITYNTVPMRCSSVFRSTQGAIASMYLLASHTISMSSLAYCWIFCSDMAVAHRSCKPLADASKASSSSVKSPGVGVAFPQFLKTIERVRWQRFPSSLARLLFTLRSIALSEKSPSLPKLVSAMRKNRV
mmetsp:Transcript_8871/g.21690  ORF Transcript_8871/g.21690 Transcript_8871/m.21690 type:complete len:202 (-) Transcript_8871:1294-1899(-)